MSRSGIYRQIIAIGAVLTALSLAGVQAACAETDMFKDTLRPHGVARGAAQRNADGLACGANRDYTIRPSELGAFERCMLAHGWAHTYTKPDAAERAAGGTVYDDMTGPSRGEAALHADRRACGSQGRLKEGNPQFAQCMASHGWRLAFSLPAPHAPTYAGGSSWSGGWSWSGGSSSTADDTYWESTHWSDQQNDWARQQMLQQSNDATSAATAAAAAQAACASTGTSC